MDANAYADEIEQRISDREGLLAIRAEIIADDSLDENARWRLSTRIGSYLANLDGETA
jgi:hypothetical protein